jgi:hypothetical protein
VAKSLALRVFLTGNQGEKVGGITNWCFPQSLGFSPMPELVKTPIPSHYRPNSSEKIKNALRKPLGYGALAAF